MKPVTEVVDLPDPAVQPLVHPLDLRPARRPYRFSVLIASATSLPVGLCLAALVWFATHSFLVPVIAGVTLVGFGALAARHFEQEAWAFIPRRRQDRARPMPATWQLASGLSFAVLLASALVLVTVRLQRPDVAPPVREFTAGAAAATGLLVVADQIRALLAWRPARQNAALAMLPATASVLGSIALSYRLLFGSWFPPPTAVLWYGAATIVLAAVLTAMARYLRHGKSGGQA